VHRAKAGQVSTGRTVRDTVLRVSMARARVRRLRARLVRVRQASTASARAVWDTVARVRVLPVSTVVPARMR